MRRNTERSDGMKKIKNKRRLYMGIVLSLLAIACGALALGFRQGGRYLVGAGLLFTLALVNYCEAFRKPDVVEEIVRQTDKEHVLLAMKSCQCMVRIMNYVLLGATLFSLVLYGGLRNTAFLIVAVTLCSVLVLMFGITLAANVYYEKREKERN